MGNQILIYLYAKLNPDMGMVNYSTFLYDLISIGNIVDIFDTNNTIESDLLAYLYGI